MTDKARDYAYLNDVDLAKHHEALFALIELSCLAIKHGKATGQPISGEIGTLAMIAKDLVLHIKQLSRESRMAEPGGNKMDN